MLDSGMGGFLMSFRPAVRLTCFPAYFSSPFAIVCSCMLLVPS
ncbi:MAG: hypothetical protein QOH59_1116 [Gemmatimonadales bacterium]|jgi:hypothetical protein|nr:hypothetical protein [Gemmatimonadales bacterium]